MSHANNKTADAIQSSNTTAHSVNTFSNPKDVKDFNQYPDARGHFGVHGGRFVSETLMAALEELEALYNKVKADPAFWEEYHTDLVNYVGRPTPLYHAKRWSDEVDCAQISFGL